MPNRPITDVRELVKAEVDQHMRAYVTYNTEEHQQTRQAFKRLEDVVIDNKQGARLVIHEFLIAALFIGMALVLTGC